MESISTENNDSKIMIVCSMIGVKIVKTKDIGIIFLVQIGFQSGPNYASNTY
jgi:hypothetical protein